MGGDRQALDHQVGALEHHLPVLERARLALVGIEHDIALGDRLLAHAAPLDVGREAGAPPPLEPRGLELVADPTGAALAGDTQRLVAAPAVGVGPGGEIDRLLGAGRRVVHREGLRPAAPVPGGRSRVAAADAGDEADLLALLLEIVLDLLAPGQPAGEPLADEDVGLRTAQQVVEAGDPEDVRRRDAGLQMHLPHGPGAKPARLFQRPQDLFTPRVLGQHLDRKS